MSAGYGNSPVPEDTSFDIGNDKVVASSDDEIKKSIQRSQTRWGTNNEGTLYWGTGDTADAIAPGLYKCGQSDQIGPYLQVVKIETDELIQLPDMVCNEAIHQIQAFWTEKVKQAMAQRGFLHKRGILMYGEPGSGKTCTIQILVKMLVGNGGIAIHAEDPHVLANCLQLIRRIEPDLPLIVILEDFDTLTDRDRRENTWLSVLDGEGQVNNVVFLATTNYIQQLDKRIVDRPSRFDVILKVPMPTAKARAAYIRHKEPDLSDDDLYEWVQASEHYSIAHLKEMMLSILCYGKTLEETKARLDGQRQRDFSNEDLENEAKGSGGIGFTQSAPTGKFADRADFDKFVADELEHWDYEV